MPSTQASMATFGFAWHHVRHAMPQKSQAQVPPKEVFTLSKHRIEGLSDGLFAIVMTLLVLDLKVPQIEGHVTAYDLLHALRANWRVFFSFFVTFCLAALFWLIQQRIFVVMRVVDRVSLLFSLVSLFFVSLLPFTAAVLGRYSYNTTAMAFYFGDQFGIVFFIALLWYRTLLTKNIAELEVADRTRMSVRVFCLAGGCLVATLAAIFKAEYGAFGFIAVVLAGRLYRKLFLHL